MAYIDDERPQDPYRAAEKIEDQDTESVFGRAALRRFGLTMGERVFVRARIVGGYIAEGAIRKPIDIVVCDQDNKPVEHGAMSVGPDDVAVVGQTPKVEEPKHEWSTNSVSGDAALAMLGFIKGQDVFVRALVRDAYISRGAQRQPIEITVCTEQWAPIATAYVGFDALIRSPATRGEDADG